MPPLTIDFITTLDGYASGEGWPGFWGLEGPEYMAWLDQQPVGADVLLMGANTYRLMSAFTADRTSGPEEAEAFDRLAREDKVVFSSTLRPPLAWPHTRLVATDPIEAVRLLKRDGDKPLRTLGSLMLCRSLLAAGLVDRFRVVMFPVITGRTGHERIYDGYPDVALELVDSRLFDGRTQLLEYVPTVLSGPPGA
ncbi:dihydrofolate reductase family protein [Raineyella sp. LH-20]|uniref:dihydrofolate reductase family protein n=1 Tax=Raineyella sp. LH-20 TaxID=3081204 RepID=UPI002952F710|nr:dihydrofolate reductase family protein [Raineyella sp. LH-20]WOP18264.1 dihydrofolate reductase family protein [Raineyella sp. LH-20]